MCTVPVCLIPPPQSLVSSPPLWPQHDAIYRTQLRGGLLAGPTTLGQTGIEEAIPAQLILTPTPASLSYRFISDAETRPSHSAAETPRTGLARGGRIPEDRGGAT